MKSSSVQTSGQRSSKQLTSEPPPSGQGGGYKITRSPTPIPADALWLTSSQVCARYGGRSQMWLWRKVKNDPNFPKPHYSGRMQLYSVPELNAYDASLILKRA